MGSLRVAIACAVALLSVLARDARAADRVSAGRRPTILTLVINRPGGRRWCYRDTVTITITITVQY